MEIISKKEFFFFYLFPIFLFSLLPLFLITGPFLSDLSISLISLSFITYCIIKKDYSFFKKKYVYFFLAFWVYLVLNSLFNNFNISSLKISFFYFRFGVFVVAMVALLKFNHNFLKYFFYCLLLCFVALIFDGYLQYFSGTNILGWEKSPIRVSSFFGDELILGSYLSRLWPIFFTLTIFFFKDSNNKIKIFVLIFILAEVLTFISGDRTAFFYINLSAIFVILFSNKLKKLRLITLTASILLIVIISIFNPSAKKRVIDMTIEQSNLINQNEEIYIFSKQHTHHYIAAYKMFLNNKIIGVGVKNFRHFCSDKDYKFSELSCSTHPHNTYIQLLSETGIIGLTFWIMLFLYFSYYVLKHLVLKFKGKNFYSDFEICILSGILISIWPFVPTGNVFNNWLSVTYFIYLPFIIWARDEKKNFRINF